MSDSATSNGLRESNPGTRNLELDVSKLHSLPSEQQDLFLLTFVSDLVRHVQELDNDALPAHQSSIKKQLVTILSLSSPAPSRPIRDSLAIIYVEIFVRGSRSLLYESITELVDITNAGKAEKDLKNKHAAVVCLGRILGSAGDSAASLSGLTLSSLLKLLKQAQNHAGLRAAVYKALGRAVGGIGSSVDESSARDVWKSARAAASNEKAMLSQKTACYCLERLVSSTPYFDAPNDLDVLKTTIWRTFESPVTSVRHAAASALASAFVKLFSQSETSSSSHKTTKGPKKVAHSLDGEDEIDRPSSSTSKKHTVPLSLSLHDILRTLASHYTKSSTSNRARAGVMVCYKYTVLELPEKIVEERYSVIATHLFDDVLNHPTIRYNRHRLLLCRRMVRAILDDTIGLKILSESAQLNATQWLLTNTLKNFPQTAPDQHEPSKQVVIAALSSVSKLLSCLGPAAGPVAENCREVLFQVLQHPSYTAQIYVSHCLRALVLACPQQLLICAHECMDEVKKYISKLNESRLYQRRSVGCATALAAVISTSRSQPLYGSVEVFSEVLITATELLKASSGTELRVSATQVQTAWILVGGLMPLGPNFVKIHLNQLLLLWRNALPRPLTQNNATKKGPLETSFLAHVRECALGALLVFLEYNGSLITTDGSRRIATMLQNTVAFYDSVPKRQQPEEIANRLIPALQLQDLMIMVQRRLLQCFTRLISFSHLEPAGSLSHSNLLSLSIASLAEPEGASHQNGDSSITSSISNFESLWELSDNWGFGINGLVRGHRIEMLGRGCDRRILGDSETLPNEEEGIDSVLLSPVCKALEHDSLRLYQEESSNCSLEADPPPTQVINAAIDLFAVVLPLQPPKVQESSLEQLAMLLSRPYTRDPGKKAALRMNVAAAILGGLVVANRETEFSPGKLAASSVEKIVADIIQESVMHADAFVRTIGVEAVGRMCNLFGSPFTNSHVRRLIDTIVANRDPNIRAGCALALGCIHSHVGGMAAGFHLKTIVGVLLSLCNDPHPIVHFWALQGLSKVADSAGLNFSGYVTSTLGMLARLYTNEPHSEEAQSLATSNLEVEYPTPFLITRCIDSLINVLGPDLQDLERERKLIERLVDYFHREESIHLVIEGSVCSGHLSLYTPGQLDFPKYVKDLQKGLRSAEERIRDISIDSLNDLVKKDAKGVFLASGLSLEDDLWLALDHNPGHAGIQNVLHNWLRQTYDQDTVAWIHRCQDVLAKTRPRPEKTAAKVDQSTAVPDLQDEEVAGFAAAAAVTHGDDTVENTHDGQEFLKWQTRCFAMSCLSKLILLVSQVALPDQATPAETALQSKIADVVRMAFSASTANVVSLRIWGLRIIDQILKLFGKTPDPDFLEASLLEQYQAQFSSALTPAFAPDSSPELASEAINVCATFVATGIVTSVERMGRIFKLLVTGLESVSGQCNRPQKLPGSSLSTETSATTTIGDLRILSANAQTMLRLSLLAAWAQLQISSTDQRYLEAIVQPYVAKLTPLWLSSLQDFARLKFEPDITSSFGGIGSSRDLSELYAALNRETLLHFYQDTWLNLIDAIAILVDKDSDFVFDALDDRRLALDQGSNGANTAGKDINFREEPVAFFFVLYGLAFEALVTQSRDNPSQTLKILQALQKIILPAVSGSAIYEDTVFDETMDMLDRLALTEGLQLQNALVEITRVLALDHPAAKPGTDRNEKLSDDIEQLFELARVMILILVSTIPSLDQPSSQQSRLLGDEAVALVRTALEALVDVADVFPSVIRSDLYACIVHTFCRILATGTCQSTVVPLAFPIFKRFLRSITSSGKPHDVGRLIRGCLWQFLKILMHAQRRENEFALPCAKNTLFAMTILLTSTGITLPANDELVNQALEEILDCLRDVGLATVAANCLRSLLLLTPKAPSDECVFRYLLPRMLHFLVDTTVEDPEHTKVVVAQSLVSSVKSVPTESRAILCATVIPVLLKHAALGGPGAHKETATRLLEVAGADQAVFRSLVGRLPSQQRDFLQRLLQSEQGQGQQDDIDRDQVDVKPSIALRMDF